MSNPDYETVAFDDVWIEHETDKAVLCFGIKEHGVWIPKSQVHDNSEIWKKGDEGTLVITRWWAEKDGLV